MDDTRQRGESAYSRARFLAKSGVAGVAVLGGTLWATAPAAAHARRAGMRWGRLRHLVISCQENRSFDHYFGYAPQVQARRLGPPRGYTQPDAASGEHAPYELTALTSTDPPHSWAAVHAQYDAGKMDGFYRTAQSQVGDGNAAIPYYTATELPFYYSLFRNSALCANYLRLRRVADHPRSARRRRGELEDLQHRRGRRPERGQRQRGGLLGAAGPTTRGRRRRRTTT